MGQTQKVNVLLITNPTINNSNQWEQIINLLNANSYYNVYTSVEENGKHEIIYQVVVIDDSLLSKIENLDLLNKIKSQSPHAEIIILTSTTENYLMTFQAGTFYTVNYQETEKIVLTIDEAAKQHQKEWTKHKDRIKMLLGNKVELSTLFSRPDDDDQTFDFHLKKILTHTCQLVVELLGVSHSGFILFDSDYIAGKLLAEYPQMGMLGLQIPLKSIPAEENLIQNKLSLIIQNIADEESLGQVRSTLTSWGIHSILITPVVSKDRVLGSFSLDAFGNERCFTDEEVELCKSLAAQVAIAIENLQTIEEYKKKQKLLKALIETSQHIQASQPESTLFQSIVRLATELVDYEVGGLCINRPYLRELEIVETHGFPKLFDDSPKPLVGKVLPHSEGLIGLVARTGKIGEIINYDSWLARDPIFKPYHFKTVIGIPIKNAGAVEAVLFVADKEDKQSSVKEDLDILQRYTTQVSIALQTSKLINQEQRVFSQLATLHRIGDYVQAATDLDKILHVTLTGITAIFGLRFNRAILFFLEERNKCKYLVGQKGIGQMNDPQAREAWERDREAGLFDIARYFDYLEKGSIASTPCASS